MAHKFQKKWVFTWNLGFDERVPTPEELQLFLSSISEKGVFQLERGLTTERLHYQGRFELKGPRIGKMKLLSYFSEKWDIINFTPEHEESFDSSLYCTKNETRLAGPWYVGLSDYIQKNTTMKLDLYLWQEQLLMLMSPDHLKFYKDRKVIWVEDSQGGMGKSRFMQYLALSSKDTKIVAKKLPFDRPDRIRSAVSKIAKKTDVDVFMFDFTRTLGEDSSMANFYQVVEEIKNNYIIDTMYGQYNETFLSGAVIIIFTNERFEDHRRYLSEDRWVPFQIGSHSSHNKGLIYMDGNSRIPFEQYWEKHTQTIENRKQTSSNN